MDPQIFYAIFSTLYGGFIGAFDRLGEVMVPIKDNLIYYSVTKISFTFVCGDLTMSFLISYLLKSESLWTSFIF